MKQKFPSKDSSLLEIRNEFDSLAIKLQDFGEKWAKWKSESNRYERLAKRIRAEVMAEHLGKAVNYRELMAENNNKYKEAVDKWTDADKKSNWYRVQYDVTMVKIDLLRSINSLRKTEMEYQ